MRKFFPAAALLLAACASTTSTPVGPARPESRPEQGDLIGLDANELVSRFGSPRIQVREGEGTKLQFASGSCVLDAYLYPAGRGSGVPRVTHVDARARDGRSVEQQGCIAAILAR